MLPDRPVSKTRNIDTAPLRHLLKIAGKQDWIRMVSAFVADLETIQANLVPAWNGPDFAALRANSHVLIALSGTIGDAPLHSLAQHLNAIAHAQDVTGVKELRSETMAKTAALIEELRIIQTLSGT